jgi:hypothetical protein
MHEEFRTIRETGMDQNAAISATAWATGVMAGATILYTIGTFMLWQSTRKSVETTRDALKLAFLQFYLGTPPAALPHDQATEYRQAVLQRVFPDLHHELTQPAGQQEVAP